MKSNSGFRFKFTEVKETLRYPSGRADKAVVRTQMTDDVAGMKLEKTSLQ